MREVSVYGVGEVSRQGVGVLSGMARGDAEKRGRRKGEDYERRLSFISITKTSLAFRLSRPRDTARKSPPALPTLIPNYYAPFCPS